MRKLTDNQKFAAFTIGFIALAVVVFYIFIELQKAGIINPALAHA